MKKDTKILNTFKKQFDLHFSYEIAEGIDVMSSNYIHFYNEWKKRKHNIWYKKFKWDNII